MNYLPTFDLSFAEHRGMPTARTASGRRSVQESVRLLLQNGSARPVRFYAGALLLSLMLGKFHSVEASTGTSKSANAKTTTTAKVGVEKPDALAKRIVSMRDAFDRRDWRTVERENEQISKLAGGGNSNSGALALLPYAGYWWFSGQLAQSASNAVTLGAEIDRFLDASTDTPYGDTLRREYLRTLGKADAWPQFLAASKKYTGDDNDVQCHRWRAALAASSAAPNDVKLARDSATAMTESKVLWEAARPGSDACYAVWGQLQRDQRLNNVEVWNRVRRLLDSGALADARRSAPFASDNTTGAAGFEPTTANINIDAARYLKKLDGGAPISRRPNVELALYALTRVARSNAERAATWLTGNQSRLPPEARQFAWAQIGMSGAMQQNENAVRWFAIAVGDDAKAMATLTDTQLGWKVRANLRELGGTADSPRGAAGKSTLWRDIKSAIGSMSAAEQRDSTWRYWLARAEDALGNPLIARNLRVALAKENSFYGVLAAEEIGQAPRPSWQASAPTAEALRAIESLPAARRSLALYKLDLRIEGLREWQYAVRNMNDAQLLAAAEVARAANLPDRAINTSERTQTTHDFSQRFPLPHRETLSAQARQFQLDEAWIYGLIRQESRFMWDAKSRVGAMGLMQLMPATAKWAAKQVGMKTFTGRTTDIDTNLTLGSFYLRHVLDDLGHPVLATAAYNAGPGRARRWRAETPLDGTIYAESIPFNETRDYVKKVMVNKWFYLQRLGVTDASLKSIMGVVPGKLGAKIVSQTMGSAASAVETAGLSGAAVVMGR